MTSPETKTPRCDELLNKQINRDWHPDNPSRAIHEWADLARELEYENNELRADAERYRWLRAKARRSLMFNKKHAGDIQVIQWEDSTTANVLSLEKLDAAIDAARTR